MIQDSKISKLWDHRVVRFTCIGMINTCIDVSILNTLVFVFGIKVLFANLVSATISICVSYFLNHIIVFQQQHKRTLVSFFKFFSITGLGILLVQSGVIYIVVHIFSLHMLRQTLGSSVAQSTLKVLQVNTAKCLAVLIAMVWNFTFYRLVVFRRIDSKQAGEEETVLPY